MNGPIAWSLSATLLLAVASVTVDTAAVGAEADFDATVAPVLIRACLDCHSGGDPKGGLDLSRREAVLRGGDSGAAIEPGNVSGSLLWQRVAAAEMPPKHPLDAAEQLVLRNWIASGAAWGTDPIDPFRMTTGSRAGYDWWSLQPLTNVTPPDVPADAPSAAAVVRNPIDQFILARLQEAGLSPSPEADRRLLIRRLSFDLLGLPPTPDEIEAFLADDGPDACERLVDRLLDSPHYGVHWGRHWLDLVRFGESQGFERDKLREDGWPYRDWVINALNADLRPAASPADHGMRLANRSRVQR